MRARTTSARCWLALGWATAVLLATGVAPAHAATTRVRIATPTVADAGGFVNAKASVSGMPRSTRLALQKYVARRWATIAKAKPRRRRATLRLTLPAKPGMVTVRAVVLRGRRVVAASPRRTITVRAAAHGSPGHSPPNLATVGGDSGPLTSLDTPAPNLITDGSSRFVVPADTKLYKAADIGAVDAGPHADQAVVTLGRGVAAPPVGGHAAIGPTTGLPDGMFATVNAAQQLPDGRARLVLEQTSVDDVLDDVHVDFDTPVTPTLIDADGNTVEEASGSSLDLLGTATFARRSAAAEATSMFTCKSEDNLPASAEDLWSTGSPLPIEIKLENTKVLHRFDAGNVILGRDPFLLFQFSGEAVASIGFEAEAGFTCALSTTWRRNHRLHFNVGNIGPVPVSVNLEPTLEFSVSASGEVALSQRHHFGITIDKYGFAAPGFRIAHSADPVTLTANAAMQASLFAGGDLSVMLGGGYKSANAQAGMYGAFGPKFTLATDTDEPGCIAARAHLEANIGVRLELWVKRWDFQLASLTTADRILGGPWCIGGQPSGLAVTTNTLPSALAGEPYSAQLTASGGTAPYTWALQSGALPDGLTLASNGAISGTPIAGGSGTFTARVTDAHGATADGTLTVQVVEGLGTIGEIKAVPGDATISWVRDMPGGGFLEALTSPTQGATTYLARVTDDDSPATALAIPTNVYDTAFAPDGTVYFGVGALNSFEGGELLRWRPGGTTADRLHSFGAAPALGAMRIPYSVTYLGGKLYVEALAPNVFYSCQSRLYALDTDGRSLADGPATSCGGQWDAAGGRLSAVDYEAHAARYFDPATLESAGSGPFIGQYVWSANVAPDGTWVLGSGNSSACSDIEVRRVGPTGVVYAAFMPTILGIDSRDACRLGGAVATSSGDIVVLGLSGRGLIAATIRSGSVTRTTVGPETASDLSIVADGSGAVVIGYITTDLCDDPHSTSPTTCAQLHLVTFKSGIVSTIATDGGTYGQSKRISSLVVTDGKIAANVTTAPYYCGSNCNTYGSVYAEQFFPATVTRRGWHDPS